MDFESCRKMIPFLPLLGKTFAKPAKQSTSPKKNWLSFQVSIRPTSVGSNGASKCWHQKCRKDCQGPWNHHRRTLRGGRGVSAKPQVKSSPAKKATTKIAKKALVRATATVLKENPTPYRFTPAPAARQSVHASVESLRFIDLFCGIGGFRIAFEKVGGKCVFSSDYDKFSQQTYKANSPSASARRHQSSGRRNYSFARHPLCRISVPVVQHCRGFQEEHPWTAAWFR
jgi:hypothetical protein